MYGGGVKAALALAAAGQLDLAEAASTTVGAMNMFDLGAGESSKVADALAKAAAMTTADVADFAMALKQGGSVAKLAGYGLNETVTTLEALAKATVKNSDAGTSMKTAFIQLLKPTEKQEKLARLLGIHWETQAGTLKSAAGISKELRVATGDMTKAERTKTLATLAGTDGVRTLNALYEAGPRVLQRYAAANETSGFALKVAQEQTDNLTGDVEELGGALETKAIKAFKKFSPALREGTQAVTEFIRNVDSMSLAGIAQKLGISRRELKKFEEAARNAADIFDKYVKPVIQTVLQTIFRLLQDFAKVVRGVVRVIAGILTLDFGLAWKGVKDIFEAGADGAIAIIKAISKPIRVIIGALGEGMSKAFSKVWDGIKSVFSDGVDAIKGFIQAIADVINPLLDAVGIGEIQITGGSNLEGENRKGKKGLHRQHRQRGGMLFGGAPSGDSIPALLERGEYVLNREAVKKVGTKSLDALNFGSAPRFQVGGPVEMSIGGDIWGAAKDIAGYTPPGLAFKAAKGAVNTAGDLAKGADYFINGLPVMAGTGIFPKIGNALAGKVADWIGSLPAKVFAPSGGGGGSIANAGPLQRFNHIYPEHTLSDMDGKARFSEDLVARIARWAGLPGKTFAQIAHGESNFYPGITGIDPGGTKGYGLWMITSSFNDALVGKFGGYGQMLNPLKNALAAKEIYDQRGDISAWYGTKFVTQMLGGPVGMAKGGMAGGSHHDGDPFDPVAMRGGSAPKPKLLAGTGFAPRTLGRVQTKADLIAKNFTGYIWGGGHGEGDHVTANGLDCSGAVAKLMQMSGWSWPVAHSSAYTSYGQPGEGDWLTVWSNNDHTFAEIAGKMWGTNTSNGLGYHSHTTAGFTPSHPALGGSGAAGFDELPEGIQKAREGKARKKAREVQLARLRAAVAESKTDAGKNSKLWQLIQFWGRNGLFDKDERGHILDSVREAASKVQTGESVKVLQHLAKYAGNHGEITGREPDAWKSLTNGIERAKEQGEKKREKLVERLKNKKERLRNKRLAKIAARASMPGVIEGIDKLRDLTDHHEEVAGRMVTLEPEDLTDAYVGQERSSYEGILGDLHKWHNEVVWARYFASGRINEFEQQIGSIQALKGTPAYKKQRYKLGALREGIKTLETFRNESAIGELEEIQGPGGPLDFIKGYPLDAVADSFGGRVFEIQNQLRELGLKQLGGAGGEVGTGDNSRMEWLEEELRKANQRNLVFTRQKPIIDQYMSEKFAGMFALGGQIPAGMWGIAGERGPEPVFGPATVVSNRDAKAAVAASTATQPQGIGRIVLEDRRVRVFDRSDQEIEDIIDKVGRARGRKARTPGAKRAGRGV